MTMINIPDFKSDTENKFSMRK